MASRMVRLGKVAVAILLAVNLAQLGTLIVLRSSRSGLYAADETFPAPSGYALDNQYFDGRSGPCFVLRITADACPYCKEDRPLYDELAVEANRKHCRVIEISPKTGDVAPREHLSLVQLQYVDMEFGRAMNPFMTPQTMILDDKGRVRWQHQGAMDANILRRGIATIRALP